MKIKRFLALVIDSFIIFIIYSLLLSVTLAIARVASGTPMDVKALGETFLRASCSIFMLVAVLFKDSIGGRSIGKRIFRLKVVDAGTNELPKLYKRIFRNIPFFLPIDYLIVLFGGRRIGDMIFHTDVAKQ